MAGNGSTLHFFFAWMLVINGLFYIGYSLVTRHFARDLEPTRQDWRSIGRSILDHLRFRHATGDAARRYNVLQKLAYLSVVFLMLPLLILMGLAMSPRLNAVLPGWVDLFGGRQSARTLHFIAACTAAAVRGRSCIRSHRDGILEQPALDDHRPLWVTAG